MNSDVQAAQTEVRHLLNDQAAFRAGGMRQTSPHGRSRAVDLKSLEDVARRSGGTLDGPTLFRALGLNFLLSESSTNDRIAEIAIITDPSQPVQGSDIICVDLASWKSVDAAIDWISSNRREIRAKGLYLVVSVDTAITDLSRLAILADAVVTRPRLTSPSGWAEHLAPVRRALHSPEKVDAVAADELQGAVTQEEFDVVLEQAELPDADPRKRD